MEIPDVSFDYISFQAKTKTDAFPKNTLMCQALAQRMPKPPSPSVWLQQEPWFECVPCQEDRRTVLEEVPRELGQVPCAICRKFKILVLAVRRLPRDSATFNHCIEVIDSLNRLAVQETQRLVEGEELTRAVQESQDSQSAVHARQDEPTSSASPGPTPTPNPWASVGWIDYTGNWRARRE